MRLLKVPRGSTRTESYTYTALELDHLSKRLFAARSDGVVIVWRQDELVEVANMETPTRESIVSLKSKHSNKLHNGVSITSLKLWRAEYLISADIQGSVYKTKMTQDGTAVEFELLFDHTSRINDLVILGDIVFFATANQILVFDLVNLKQLSPITLKSDIRSITIDPSHNFLVSIGSNKAVLVHQIQIVNGGVHTKKVSNVSLTLQNITNASRFSWSEAGDKFAVPNINLDPDANAVGIISRKNWKSEFSLVGHLCSAVKFNTRTFYDPKTKLTFNIVASAGSDRSLAVWNTTCQRPLFNAIDISKGPIDDLAWGKDGLSLFAASDALVVLTFEEGEFGEFATEDMVNELKAKVAKPEPFVKEEQSDEPSTSEGDKVLEKEDIGSPKQRTTQRDTETKETITLQTPTITKSGKKRIAPTLLSNVNGSKPILSSKAKEPNAAAAATAASANTTMQFDQPSYSAPKDLKRREEFNGSDQPKKKREIEPIEFIGSVAINPSTSFAKVRISTPKIRSSIILDSPNDESLSLEIRNGSGNEQKPTKISLLKNSTRQVFADFIPKLIGLATGGEGYFWAISTVDGLIHVYSDSGRKIFPPIVIGTPLSFLESKGKYLLAVSSIGEVFAWDVVARQAMFEPTSLYPLLSRSNPDLLTRAENLTLCGISSSGVPVVTVSNGNGYLFDREMGSWSLISDSWWAFGSQYWDNTDKRAATGSLITLLEKKTNDEIVRRGRGKFLQKMAKTMLMKEGYENLEKAISLAHLENRILISKQLNEDVEFKNYLVIYCKRISEMGLKARLNEIFQDLMGPKTSTSGWDSKLLSFDKHDLLKELIFACANIRSVQRILLPFATSLNILDQTDLSIMSH